MLTAADAVANANQTTTSIGSMTGGVVARRSCCGMITIRQRLDSSAASSEIGSIVWLSSPRSVPRAPSSFTTTSGQRWHSTSCTSCRSMSLMRDHHQCHVIAAHHAGEADITPLSPVTRHPVSNVTQPTPQPLYSVGQASRRIAVRYDGEARRCCCCRPLTHAESTTIGSLVGGTIHTRRNRRSTANHFRVEV